jgi:8-oxo-dGTP diphosphatase
MRSAVIIIEGGRVALIERIRDGRKYYVFPGGTIESEEAPEAAAVREAREELGLEIRLGQLAAIGEFEGTRQYYFWATPIGGKFGTGNGEEFGSSPSLKRGSYKPIWLNIDQLVLNDVYPKALAIILDQGTLTPSDKVFRIHE